MPEALIQLELKPYATEQVKRILCQRMNDAIAGAQERDILLLQLDDQLEGRIQPYGDKRWRGACILNDPMSREAHLELLALLTQAQRKDPKWQVIAQNPGDDENATLQEAWLTNKAAEYRLNNILYNVAYNALRDPCGVLFVGWKQTVRPVRKRMFRDSEFPDMPLVEGHQREEDREYEEAVVEQQEVAHQGCEFRTPDLADIYLYPADCQDIKTAYGIGERMLLTEDQLLDGVVDYGYDEEAVEELIRLGPTHSMGGDLLRTVRNEYDGTSNNASVREDGFYECFLYFGRMPKLRDDEDAIPEQYRADDLMCMLCPQQQIVFLMDISPYTDRPYISFSMLPRPNRLLGIGAMQLLATLQDEANANLQLTIDGMDLEMAPVLVAPAEWIQKYNAFSIYPGAILPEDDPNTLRTLEWGSKAEKGMELQGAIVGRGKGLVAAEGYGELQAKVRKDAEIQNVLAATDSKFDLFLQGFQSSMEELAARIVALHAQFEGEGLQESFNYQGKQMEVSAQNMRGLYRYVPTATSTTVTPEMRLKLTQAKIQAQMGYFAALAQVMQISPQFAPLIWHGVRQALLDMGERQPEEWIGPEPQMPQPQELPANIAQLVASGVPPQVIQQILASQGGLNTAPAGSGGALLQQ